MKGLSTIVTASALGLGLSFSAMAADGAQNVSSIDQSTSDLSYAFGNSENLQVKSISGQEMEDTEGAFIPPPLIYYGAMYGVPAAFAAQRWATSPAPQIWYHNIRQKR